MGKKSFELIKNTIIIFLGKACTQLISFLLLPLYTKYLITEEYGIVDLITTYVSLLVPVITLQLEMAIFRFLVDNREDKNKKIEIISTGYNLTIVFSIITLSIYLIIASFINIKYKYLIAGVIFSCIYSSISLQVARGFGENIKYSIGCCVSGISTVILNVVFIVGLKMNANGMLMSMILANVLTFIYLSVSLKINKFFKFSKFDLNLSKQLLKYSIPLVPNGISWWIVNASDRTIISAFLGVASNGIYAVSNKFSSLFMGVFNVFLLSWTESTSLHIDEDDRDTFFSKTMNTVLKLFITLCFLVITVMPFIFPILIDNKYNDAYNNIPILLIAMLFNIVVGLDSAIYIAKKMTKQVMYTSILAAIINILVNILLINYIGLYAASISTLIAYAVMALYRSYDLKKYVNIKWDIAYIFKSFIIFMLILIVYYINNFIINIISFVLICVYAIVSNKQLINKIIHKIIEKIVKKEKAI